MDLVLGRFADTQLASLTDSELSEVERWLVLPDQQIFAWVTGMEPVPVDFDTALFHRLRSFHNKDAV
jgi:antitoxin CptB